MWLDLKIRKISVSGVAINAVRFTSKWLGASLLSPRISLFMSQRGSEGACSHAALPLQTALFPLQITQNDTFLCVYVSSMLRVLFFWIYFFLDEVLMTLLEYLLKLRVQIIQEVLYS